MSDFLGLDEFVASATRTEEQIQQEQQLTPIQRDELGKGAWCMYFDDLRGGSPATWRVGVGYIFADQDFVALSAIEGGDVDQLVAEQNARLSGTMRFGRFYTAEHPTGQLLELGAWNMLPITEEQAEEVRYCEFKLPIIMTMCDWFGPLLEQVIEEFEHTGTAGYMRHPCPKCGHDSCGLLVTYSGTAVLSAMQSLPDLPPKITTGPAHVDRIDEVQHAHWVCPKDECDYDECVDMNTWEIGHN